MRIVGRPEFRRPGGLYGPPAGTGNQALVARRQRRALKKQMGMARESRQLGAADYRVFIPKTKDIMNADLNRGILASLIADLNSETYRFLEELSNSYTVTPMVVDFESAITGGFGGMTKKWAYDAMKENLGFTGSVLPNINDSIGDGVNYPHAPSQNSERYKFGYWVAYYLVTICQKRDSNIGGFQLTDLLEVLAGRKTLGGDITEQRGARFAAWMLLKLPEIFPKGVFGNKVDGARARKFAGHTCEFMDDSEWFQKINLYTYPALYGFSAINKLVKENLPVTSFSYLGDRQSVVDGSASTTSSLCRVLGTLVSTGFGMSMFQNMSSVASSSEMQLLTDAGKKVAISVAQGANKMQETAYIEGKLNEEKAAKIKAYGGNGKLTDAEVANVTKQAKQEWAVSGNGTRDTGPAKQYANSKGEEAVIAAQKEKWKPMIDEFVSNARNNNEATESDQELRDYAYAELMKGDYNKLTDEERNAAYNAAYDKAYGEWGSAADRAKSEADQKRKEKTEKILAAAQGTTAVATGLYSANAERAAAAPATEEQFTTDASMSPEQVSAGINACVNQAVNIGASTLSIAATVPPPAGPIAAGIYAGVCLGAWIGTALFKTIVNSNENEPEYAPGSAKDYNDINGDLEPSEQMSHREYDQAYMTAMYCWTALRWVAGDGENYTWRGSMIGAIQNAYQGLPGANNPNDPNAWMYKANFDNLAQRGFKPAILDTTIVLINKNNMVYSKEYESFIGPDGPFVRAAGLPCAKSTDCPPGMICVGTTCVVDPNYKPPPGLPPEDNSTKIALALGGLGLLLIIGSAMFGKERKP